MVVLFFETSANASGKFNLRRVEVKQLGDIKNDQ